MSDMKDRVMQVILAEADVEKGFIPDHAKNKFSDNSGNLKCPFCQQELKISGHELHDLDLYCDKCEPFMVGNKELWQSLINERQHATDCQDLFIEAIAQKLEIETELKLTRKALDVATDALKSAHEYYEYCIQRDKDCDSDDINWDCTAMNMDNDISDALEQITALEQKDHIADISKKVEQKEEK